jgi:hypothetical protein
LEFIVRKKKASDITEAWRKLALFDQSSSVVLRLSGGPEMRQRSWVMEATNTLTLNR